MSAFIKEVTASDFDKEVIEKSKKVPVLIDFWASWCAPCKQLMPLLHQIVESLDGTINLATIDTDKEQELSTNYGIRSLPTVLLMKNGEIVEQFMGVKPEDEIRKLLKPYLTQKSIKKEISSNDLQIAMDLLKDGQVLEAIPYLQKESSLHGRLLLIKIYLQEGEIEKAIDSFAQLTSEEQSNDEAQTIKTILNLIQKGQKSQNTPLQQAIDYTVSVNPEDGINQLLQLLSHAKADEKDDIKQSLICAFGLINDAKTVSQLRRKMAALIF